MPKAEPTQAQMAAVVAAELKLPKRWVTWIHTEERDIGQFNTPESAWRPWTGREGEIPEAVRAMTRDQRIEYYRIILDLPPTPEGCPHTLFNLGIMHLDTISYTTSAQHVAALYAALKNVVE